MPERRTRLPLSWFDAVGVAGVGLLAWGLWMAWPPLAPAAVGALLLGVYVRAEVRG